jgi:hypothetical protein
MKEVDGLVGGRVVRFKVQVCWRKKKIKGDARKKKKDKKKRWENKL